MINVTRPPLRVNELPNHQGQFDIPRITDMYDTELVKRKYDEADKTTKRL